jgi:hypothetical protein
VIAGTEDAGRRPRRRAKGLTGCSVIRVVSTDDGRFGLKDVEDVSFTQARSPNVTVSYNE